MPEEELIFKGIGVIPKEKKKRIILEDFHTLNTKGLYTAPHRVLFIIISGTEDRALFRIDGQVKTARREAYG